MAFMGVLWQIVFFLLVIIAVMLMLITVFVISMLQYRKNDKLERLMQSATLAVGKIMDCRQLHGSGNAISNGEVKSYRGNAYPFLYEFSVAYPCSDGMQHIAFFGLRCKTPLPFTIADSVSVRMFSQPLQPIPFYVMDNNRAIDGYLPQMVYHNAWQGVPVDETATLMLQADHERLEKRFRRKRRIAFVFLVICMALLLILIVPVCSAFFLA